MVASAGLANAQGTLGTDETQMQPQPQPQPQPPPPPPRADPPEPMMTDGVGPRPDGMAFGIGVGYALPSQLDQPDAISFRVRLATGMTIEPRLVVGNASTSRSTSTTDTKDSSTEFGVAALVRLPMIKRGRADFEVIGAVGVDSVKDNPEGDDNNTTTTSFGLGWGLGIGFWISPHWQISATASNPLISYTTRSQETGPDESTKTSTTSLGLIFDPTITFMVHLYN